MTPKLNGQRSLGGLTVLVGRKARRNIFVQCNWGRVSCAHQCINQATYTFESGLMYCEAHANLVQELRNWLWQHTKSRFLP
jgi:hypothetical protein